MSFRSRRTVYYLLLVAVTTLVFTVAYNTGMALWEGHQQPLYRSLEIVIQSFTTTGYGEDAPWQTPQMNALVIAMQLAGIGLILTAVDVFAVPWLRSALTPTAPDAVTDVEDHVIICGHTPRTDAFITELEARDQEYVLVESNHDAAGDLHESGYRVVHGDPEATTTLSNVGIETALAVVTDVTDEINASITLSAREAAPDIRVITLVEDAELAQYHRAAGADDVLSPRQLLGRSLATEIPTAVTTEIDEGVSIDENFELVEVAVAESSELCQQTFVDARLRQRFGVNVIGAWFNGDFESPVDPTDKLTAGTRLLVIGESEQVAALQEATTATVQAFSSQRVVLAGYGDSGQAAYDALHDSHSNLTVLDIEDGDQVDCVGDARDPAVLEEVGITDMAAMVLMVGDDTTAIFTTLIARELNPDLHIVVRANEEPDVEKLYQAGADYVQSLATVSGRMLASTVFEDEEVLVYDRQISVVRLPADGLEGRTLAGAAVRSETGCTVVAIDRGSETITDFDPTTTTFEAGDEVVVAGTDESITRFERRFS
ncbi:potassium channel family protein [Halosimplex pelagicum]|uniref:NAD-binding protein n=1 Tax=Halosimplex pelagicum TaxID=869886 RepID=A0A7D5TCI4_9EURY|nr:NAD-binding protein [Halosimplex pelagicum]QLH82095.1 NAD-binding protein [Halosimplex pelagicum]